MRLVRLPRGTGCLLVPALGGCAPPEIEYTDRWTPTAAACGWEDVVSDFNETGEVPTDVWYPSEACVDRVLADFNADVGAFLEADDLDDPYDLVGNYEPAWSRVNSLLDSARGFFILDMGELEDVEASELTSSEFVEHLHDVHEQTGLTAVGALLYAFVTSTVADSRPADPDEPRYFASFGRTRHLWIGPAESRCVLGTATLVHEVRHYWGPSHIECGSGTTCDADIDGAYGYELAALLRILNNQRVYGASTGVLSSDVRSEIEDELMARRIASFQGEPGELLSHWEDTDLADY